MRRVRLVFLLVLVPIALSAQTSDGATLFSRGTALYQQGDFSGAYDALTASIRALESSTGDNRERLMNAELWAGAAAFRLGLPAEAEAHYRAALRFAGDLDDSGAAAGVATALANLKNSTRDYAEAAEWYQSAAASLLEVGNALGARQSTEYAGYMFNLAGSYESAFEIFDAALAAAGPATAASRPAAELAWLYSMRGNCNYSLERLPAALADYEAAVALLAPSGSSAELARYNGWIGKILFDRGETDAASEIFSRALSTARAAQAREDESRILAYLGFLHASLGNYDRGADYYEQSLKIALSLDRVDFVIAAYDSLAWIYEQAGRTDRELDARRKLVAAYAGTDDDENRALALNDYALALYYAGDVTAAVPVYEQALALQDSLGNLRDQAVILLNLGVALEEVGRKEEAVGAVERGMAISMELGNLEDAEDALGFLGHLYTEASRYRKLIDVLERFVPIYESAGRQVELMHLLNNIGTFHYSVAEYADAIESYRSALVIARELGSRPEQAIHLTNIGQAQAGLSRFDEARVSFEEALALTDAAPGVRSPVGSGPAELTDVRASTLNSLGELYRAWGWFDRSLSYYEEAERLWLETGDSAGLASVYNNMGQAVRQAGDPAGSIDFYRRALDLNTELDDDEARAVNLSNLGEAHRELGDLDTARELYAQALHLDEARRNLRGINIRKNNLGLVLYLSGHAEAALPYFAEGLEYWRGIGDRREEAAALTNLGDAYFDVGDYARSAANLEQAVAIQEDLRETARGAVRREYLQNQISVYRSLAKTYLYDGQVWRSLYALELSRAKYLLEQMAGGLAGTSFDYDTLLEFQTQLGPSSALLSVSRLDSVSWQVILLDDEHVAGRAVLLDSAAIDELYDRYSRQIIRQTEDPDGDHLDGLLTYYRSLLARPALARADSVAMDEIGAFLYSLTVGPMEERLGGIRSLVIVPDGLLAVVPFETFRDADGRYLVDRFDISYAQSLVVALRSIERVRPPDRQPMIAFGGAVYEPANTGAANGAEAGPADTSTRSPAGFSPGDLEGMRQEASDLIAGGLSTRGAYSRMGLDIWRNLPGSLEEVTMLEKIVPGATVYTGSEVSESHVKELSNDGALSDYKVIHFATHGIVVPEVPELSAVVLSQFGADGSRDGGSDNRAVDNGEDGYLTMQEISELEIAADFVNLSACETGLGKVYAGEGIVGLSQAFLIAGADALSVSLWQVADESTREFMAGLYSLVEERGLGYAAAMSEMKRRFLHDERYGNRYRNPFFWAPFVFYGDFGAGR